MSDAAADHSGACMCNRRKPHTYSTTWAVLFQYAQEYYHNTSTVVTVLIPDLICVISKCCIAAAVASYAPVLTAILVM